MRLHLDLETRSAVDLKKVGAHRYAEDPSTEIVCGSYRFDDGPVQSWQGRRVPATVAEYIRTGGSTAGFNQQFERVMLRAAGVECRPEQQDCAQSRSVVIGLPDKLERAAEVLKVDAQKDKEGHRLMLRMCRPKTLEPLTWHEDPVDVERLSLYCDQDVRAECAVDARLPRLSERERRCWNLDQAINDRGIAVDVPGLRKALAAVAEASRRADRRIWELTGGAVSKVTQVRRIVDWINAMGVPCESVADGEEEDLIVGAEIVDRPEIVAVVALRQASAKAFKFQAMLDHVCRDGRVRGSLAYHGAFTGRWAGRGIQPQNFKRIEDEEDEAKVRATLEVLDRPFENASQLVDQIELVAGDPLEALSLISRPMLIAAPGKKLIGGDFTNIEGRLNAWFAGEAWKLDAFRDFDEGSGPDLYRVMAASINFCEVEAVTRAQRQEQGKVPELACGYQGGLGAFKKMGAKYGVRLEDARIMQIVRGWRGSNPRIVESWEVLQQGALDAVSSPGMVVTLLDGKVQYVVSAGFLWCKLPSGRLIAYAAPKIEWKTKEVTIDGETVEISRYGISYWGTKGGRWMKLDLYGGAQCAHVVSGTARDVLVEAMFQVEGAGFPIVLTVHDEIVSEVADYHGNPDAYQRLMESPIAWAKGCPIVAKCWEGSRYSK